MTENNCVITIPPGYRTSWGVRLQKPFKEDEEVDDYRGDLLETGELKDLLAKYKNREDILFTIEVIKEEEKSS